jgi:ribosomal protein S27E
LLHKDGSKKEDEKMEIKCFICGHEVNLDHGVFANYVGTVKCFSCSYLMEVEMKGRVLHGTSLLSLKKHFPRVEQKVESSSSGKGITE